MLLQPTFFTNEQYLMRFVQAPGRLLRIASYAGRLIFFQPWLYYRFISNKFWIDCNYPDSPPRIDGAHLYRLDEHGLKATALSAGLKWTKSEESPVPAQAPFISIFHTFTI
jgi:hypothetical protein